MIAPRGVDRDATTVCINLIGERIRILRARNDPVGMGCPNLNWDLDKCERSEHGIEPLRRLAVPCRGNKAVGRLNRWRENIFSVHGREAGNGVNAPDSQGLQRAMRDRISGDNAAHALANDKTTNPAVARD